jgi:hypothetical protein
LKQRDLILNSRSFSGSNRYLLIAAFTSEEDTGVPSALKLAGSLV